MSHWVHLRWRADEWGWRGRSLTTWLQQLLQEQMELNLHTDSCQGSMNMLSASLDRELRTLYKYNKTSGCKAEPCAGSEHEPEMNTELFFLQIVAQRLVWKARWKAEVADAEQATYSKKKQNGYKWESYTMSSFSIYLFFYVYCIPNWPL